ncbi:hypothetical protein B0T24DRAFT_589855 [Lasiosphaeria ovina]|uniref:Uncharacterized protein n=1 Tax=Lasiosphaeria ovina TaxID=92902 RepID=A0AAE0KN29_9PEZI|nr:hypothetical protein B0T24DRAFT_589855 [Lasiosphaeria ovina]
MPPQDQDSASSSHVLFGAAPRNSAIRTYSRKGKSRGARTLPDLRARPQQSDVPRRHTLQPAVQNDNGGLGESRSRERRKTHAQRPRESSAVSRVLARKDHKTQAHPHMRNVLRGNAENEKEGASSGSECSEMESSRHSSRAAVEFEEHEESNDEGENESEDEESPSTADSSLDNEQMVSSRLNFTQARRGPRRRPCLIFDKIPPRGFKKLQRNTNTGDKSPESLQYRLGDGFSADEAKPSGLIQLMRKRKQPFSIPASVGVLDLTQSTPPPPKKRKRSSRKDINEDNSFLPTPKLKKPARKAVEKRPKLDLQNQTTQAPPAPNTGEQRAKTQEEISANHGNEQSLKEGEASNDLTDPSRPGDGGIASEDKQPTQPKKTANATSLEIAQTATVPVESLDVGQEQGAEVAPGPELPKQPTSTTDAVNLKTTQTTDVPVESPDVEQGKDVEVRQDVVEVDASCPVPPPQCQNVIDPSSDWETFISETPSYGQRGRSQPPWPTSRRSALGAAVPRGQRTLRRANTH